ncbi:MAG: TatD family hydrolase [Candidatus Thorarchaeota archaeon]
MASKAGIFKLQLFDAHTHIDMKHFQNDRERVLQRAKDAGLVGMVTCSIHPGSFRRTLGILKKHEGFVHHSAGCQVSRLTKSDADTIISLTRKYANDIVAVGEVGLDYHWVKAPSQRKAQEPLFRMFVDLAEELKKPLVIHSRKADAEAVDFLERSFSGDVLMHCFDGDADVTERVRDNGWHITLPANFRKYRNRTHAARVLPLGQIMLETDGPYLSPVEGRNEPANLTYGCRSLSELRGLPMEEIAAATTKNAKKFYGL